MSENQIFDRVTKQYRERKKPGRKPKSPNTDFKKLDTFTMKPGKYYIGDICYFLNKTHYDNVWGGKFGYSGGHYERPDGTGFIVGGTAYGDGRYKGSNGISYAVDAAVIGIVSLELGSGTEAERISTAISRGSYHEFTEHVSLKNSGVHNDRLGIFEFTSGLWSLTIDTR
jgi:hypothetical protein